MKIIIAVFLIFGFLACDVEARDKWTKEDTIRQLVFTGLQVIDWRQTRYMSKHTDRYLERNLALGKYPAARKVNTYFAATTVLHAVAGYYMPSKLRNLWQYGWIAVESGCVTYNFTAGVRVDFN